MDLTEFHQEFLQAVFSTADATGELNAEAFFEVFSAHVIESGDVPNAERAYYWNQSKGIRVDGYAGHPADSGDTLTVFIQDFTDGSSLQTINRTELKNLFERLIRFLKQARNEDFLDQLEETSPVFGLAFLVSRNWEKFDRVRLFLLTNKKLSVRIDGMQAGELDGVELAFNVWDLERLHRYVLSGREREEIDIDFVREYGGVLPVLRGGDVKSGQLESYMAIIPGQQLSDIYDKWGTRLFEQNVRVFLQSRGAVNKGIRRTIENEPEMFLAYNNGLSATAEEVTLVGGDHGLAISRIKNLQIVNGAQTTAAIHAARREFASQIGKISVQVKITLVPEELVDTVVPRISEYANSQNRVTAADFFSNHPFHVRIEEFSRRKYVAGADGSFRQSKWFYERARGQYLDARAQGTPTDRKRFDLEYPKSMVVNKTDWAKFQRTWEGDPHGVSRGAQKNFAVFAQDVAKRWEADPDQFNEWYYEAGIAKAIIFKSTEKLVSGQAWYEGGYRANIVTYALAKIAHDAGQIQKSVNFESVWRGQGLTEELESAIARSAYCVANVLTSDDRLHKNVTEWAKQEACWTRVQELEVDWPRAFLDSLISAVELKDISRKARREQKMDNDIKAQIAVANAGRDFWRSALEWASVRNLVTAADENLLLIAAAMPERIPNGTQSLKIVEVYHRLHQEGFPQHLESL